MRRKKAKLKETRKAVEEKSGAVKTYPAVVYRRTARKR
jgi:hypothetical protein